MKFECGKERRQSVMKNNKRFTIVMALTLALAMVFSSAVVNAAAKKLTLKASSNTVAVGKTVKIKANTKVNWKTSNKKIATVSSNGVVTGKNVGTTTITATSKANKRLKKSIKITVKELPVVDKDAKTVTIKCTVTDKVNSKESIKHWFIVNEKGGKAKEALLNTAVSTDDFYNAIRSVAGDRMWNNKYGVQFKGPESIDDQIAKNIGSTNYAKFDTTVTWGDKTYKLSDIITKPEYDGEKYDGSYDIAFAGNIDSQRKIPTGCITCFGGCWLGITSGHDTKMDVRYVPENLPAKGQTVTVTYTLK